MERYVLFAVTAENDEEETEKSLLELSDLLETAGGEMLCYMIQNRPTPDNATYLGKGKADELREIVDLREADGVVCDDELSPVQLRNLGEVLGCKVLDRTMLILDIFAAHAVTKEGKIQVEMAQLKYRMSHLRGIGTALSRLGGGIGTRGPGETKLETDRRAIARRIASLSHEIKEMKQARNVTRKKRSESLSCSAAIVGYTNAGKSTLLNHLTNADVLAENKLFATLDPKTSVCILPGGEELMLTDTVGFINKLPHQLIDAFRSTLEEARYADMLIHVVDTTDPEADMHMEVVYRTLSELEITGKPVITVFNKCDLPESDPEIRDSKADTSVRLSARTGLGCDGLLDALENILRSRRKYLDIVIPYNEGEKLSRIRKYGTLLSEEYTEDGIHITAYVPPQLGI